MDWTDTLMLESTRENVVSENSHSAIAARLVTAHGVSLLHVDARTYEETAAALALLRGVRATGRRVVLCDTSHLARGRQLGAEVVEYGAAEVLVTCGLSGREIAIGARDAGLALGDVVVCDRAKVACDVLVHRLVPGDTVLLLGIDTEACDQLVEELHKRSSKSFAVAR